MKSQTSLSFQSNSFLGGKRLEQSILNDYKRAIFDQSSLCFQTQSLQYSLLPSNIPSSLRESYTHCIYLEGNHFYEVFTISIFEYLIREPTPKRLEKIQKFKTLICCDKFLPQASYLKGLLLKGLKGMIQSSDNINQPIASCLLGSDKLNAFNECWKYMICQSSTFASEDKDNYKNSIISMLATFFDVEIHMFTLKGQKYEIEVVKSLKKSKQKTAIIPLILISNHYLSEGQQNLKQQSFSSISSIQGYWSYYLLVNYPSLTTTLNQLSPSWKKRQFQNNKQKTLLVEYPQLFQDASIQKIPTKANKYDFLQKGKKLIQQMKQFATEVQKI